MTLTGSGFGPIYEHQDFVQITSSSGAVVYAAPVTQVDGQITALLGTLPTGSYTVRLITNDNVVNGYVVNANLNTYTNALLFKTDGTTSTAPGSGATGNTGTGTTTQPGTSSTSNISSASFNSQTGVITINGMGFGSIQSGDYIIVTTPGGANLSVTPSTVSDSQITALVGTEPAGTYQVKVILNSDPTKYTNTVSFTIGSSGAQTNAPVISTTTLPDATVGTPYSQQLLATNISSGACLDKYWPTKRIKY